MNSKVIYSLFLMLFLSLFMHEIFNDNQLSESKGKKQFYLGVKTEFSLKDINGALVKYQESCELNYSEGCLWSGIIMNSKNIKGSQEYFKHGCTLKNNECCRRVKRVNLVSLLIGGK